MAVARGIRQRGKTGVFYAVQHIPADVRHEFGGQAMKWVSLGTTDEVEALRLGGPILADIKDRIRAARRGDLMASAASAPVVHVPIHPAQAGAVIDAWRDAQISAAQVAAFNFALDPISFPPSADQRRASAIRAAVHENRFADIEGIDETIVAIFAASRVKVTEGHPAMPGLRRLAAEAMVRVEHWKDEFRLGRLDGWPEVDEEGFSAAPASTVARLVQPRSAAIPGPSEGMRLEDLFDRWIAFKPDADESRMRWVVRRLAQYLGDPDINAITKPQMEGFTIRLREWPKTKRDLSDLGFEEVIEQFAADPDYPRISAMTHWNNWLGVINRLFKYGVERDYLDRNPLIMPRKPSDAMQERSAWADEDIAEGFSTPLFMGSADAKADGSRKAGLVVEPGPTVIRDAKYWLPLLALWTGARVEEVAGAKAADVKEEDGIWFIDLRHRSLKNKQSQRQIPIHSKLIELGFIRHAQAQPEGGYLFAELPHVEGDDEASSRNFTSWFGRWATANAKVKGQGIDDPMKPFHSLRHTFKRACRDAAVSEEMHDLLTGHKGNGGVGRGYGRGVGLSRLAQEIERVSFPTFPALPVA